MSLEHVLSLIELEKFDEAVRISNSMTDPNLFNDVLIIKALIAFAKGDHEKTIELLSPLLEINDGNNSLLRFYLSSSMSSIGLCREGWEQSFQAKLDTKTILGQDIKRFNGKSLFINQPPPAVVHIHSTSGEGDNICLMRYLPLLVEKGYTVRYEAKAGAVKLARDSFHDIEVIQLATDYPGTTGVSDFDYHLPTDDLPYVLQTELDTIPWSGPYIKSDSELVKKYKSCKNKIGICWSTGPKSGQWKERYLYRKSIVFDLLKPIIEIDPCRFVAVQAGPTRLVNNLIADVLPKDERLLNWAETAALIENLDLLISIDTSVAHLAASMGKQVWLMLSDYSYGWQFMAKRPDCSWNDSSPWYPSMRIFRQRERDDWDPVINDIVKELEIKYGSRS